MEIEIQNLKFGTWNSEIEIWNLKLGNWNSEFKIWDLENEFLKKTPSPKFGLEFQLGTSNFGGCQFNLVLTKISLNKSILKFLP